MNLILIEPDEIHAGLVSLYDHRAEHIIGVLGAPPGATIRVGLVNGPLGTATVLERDDQAVSVTLQCAFAAEPPPRPAVDLLLALPRPKVMRRLWAQLAALGVGRIMLTNAERVERNYFDTHVLTEDEYRPLLIEGLQQARDTHLPVVSIHRQLKILIEDHLDAMTGDALRLVTHPGVATSIDDTIRQASAGAPLNRVLVAVGPEGGWNAFELDLFRRHRFEPVGLGPRTLRVDTACVAILALVHDALDRSRLR